MSDPPAVKIPWSLGVAVSSSEWQISYRQLCTKIRVSRIGKLPPKGLQTAWSGIGSKHLNILLLGRSALIAHTPELLPRPNVGYSGEHHFIHYLQVSSWLLSVSFATMVLRRPRQPACPELSQRLDDADMNWECKPKHNVLHAYSLLERESASA